MDLKVQKIGNSYMVTIPRMIMKEAQLKAGQMVSVKYSKGKIIMKKTNEKSKKYDMMSLVGHLNPKKKLSNDEIMKIIKEGPYERLS